MSTSVVAQQRRLYQIALRPLLGSRFQPTGFPDIGAAEFDRPAHNGNPAIRSLIVESAQSMANRLEGEGWDEPNQRPIALLNGLPYVRVLNEAGEYLTSSRTESHRLASGFVKDAIHDDTKMLEVIKQRLELKDGTPLSPATIAGAIMALDPLCLVHGVFFADKEWPGQPKVARAVTGFIEAEGVTAVHSGGVKRDHVGHGKASDTDKGAKEGYGSIPYHRTEYTASKITAFFSVDLAQLRSYGLGEAGTRLLDAIARWEIRSFLDGGMRLRTACDLEVDPDAEGHGIVTDERSSSPLGLLDELANEVEGLIGECRDLLGDGAPIEATWIKPKGSKPKKGQEA